jgi:hypothetical protein
MSNCFTKQGANARNLCKPHVYFPSFFLENCKLGQIPECLCLLIGDTQSFLYSPALVLINLWSAQHVLFFHSSLSVVISASTSMSHTVNIFSFPLRLMVVTLLVRYGQQHVTLHTCSTILALIPFK